MLRCNGHKIRSTLDDANGTLTSLLDVMGNVSVLPTRVVVVDDHIMVSEIMALSVSKERDLSLVGIANTERDVSEVLQREHPDVILLNYRKPDRGSVNIIRAMLEESPTSRVVMLSGNGDDDLLREAIDAGCTGIIGKDCSIAEILSAIRRAARGELVTSSVSHHHS
jgi:DNA-binding NarL/FixJ family response regulator